MSKLQRLSKWGLEKKLSDNRKLGSSDDEALKEEGRETGVRMGMTLKSVIGLQEGRHHLRQSRECLPYSLALRHMN